jgi:hypothetical protein
LITESKGDVSPENKSNAKNTKLVMKGSDSSETNKTEWNKKQKKERINIEEMK